MFFKKIISLTSLLAMGAQGMNPQTDQQSLLIQGLNELRAERTETVRKAFEAARTNLPPNKIIAALLTEKTNMCFLVFFSNDEVIDEPIKEALYRAAHFFCYGQETPFTLQKGLDIYYSSSRPFDEYMEEFFKTTEGQESQKTAMQTFEQLKSSLTGDSNYDGLEAKAFLMGFKNSFASNISIIESVIPETHSRTNPNHKKLSSAELATIMNDPQKQLWLLKYMIGKKELAINTFLKQEFPDSHVLFWHRGLIQDGSTENSNSLV